MGTTKRHFNPEEQYRKSLIEARNTIDDLLKVDNHELASLMLRDAIAGLLTAAEFRMLAKYDAEDDP